LAVGLRILIVLLILFPAILAVWWLCFTCEGSAEYSVFGD